MQTEPYHPNQNPAERRIQDVKNLTLQMIDRTDSPSNLWYLCMQHATDILNHLAHTNLNYKTPTEMMYGITPDISSLIQFHWYQPVLNYKKNASFPDSKEEIGHFVGVSHNVGDSLAYKVLNENNQVINRSVVRPCSGLDNPNKRVMSPDDVKVTTVSEEIKAFDTLSDQIPASQLKLPYINPEHLIGFKFVADYNGRPYFTQVKEQVADNKFKVTWGDGEHEDILSYN